MKRAVVNSSPLIYLAKACALNLLLSIYTEVLIPLEVYREAVIKGLEKGFKDAIAVKKAVDSRQLSILKAYPRRSRTLTTSFPCLDRGEAEVLTLALAYKPCHVIIDDKLGRIAVRMLGIEVHGTLYIIIMAIRKGLISSTKTLELLNRLEVSEFRLSTEVYLEMRKRLEKL